MTLPTMCAFASVGLFTGGLINYIACLMLRSEDPLSQSIPHETCQHRHSLWEMIPLVSFFCPTNACRHCRQRLFFEYPFIEIFTAAAFLALISYFHLTAYAIGMMVFVSILITVCITDFRAKIIPHEITYPTIILGLIFSTQVRSD